VIPPRIAWIGAVACVIGCAGARRINPELASAPSAVELPQGFEFSCTTGPGREATPRAALRLCRARRTERVTARRTGDGGLRIRIRFPDARGQRLELYLYRSGRGAFLVERHSREDQDEIEPDRGWISIDHLDVRSNAASGRYALTFGRVRMGGSFAVNTRRVRPRGGEAGTQSGHGAPQRGRRP